jgi:hypothetical protein
MNTRLVVHKNGESQLEYDREIALPEHQQAYLDRMDEDMDKGISMGDTQLSNPDAQQKAQYVALILAQAVEEDNEATAAATMAYLATRLPDLKQVKLSEVNGQPGFEFIFDREFQSETPINFVSPADFKGQ